MFYICPGHSPEFLKKHDLKIEVFISKYDDIPESDKHPDLIGAVHLPYVNLNLAAIDDRERQRSIEEMKLAINAAMRYNQKEMVMHILGIVTEYGNTVGTYERVIDSIRNITDYAATKGVIICLENQAFHDPNRTVLGTSADEWFKIRKDVGRDNLLLTLDTSHSATAAAHIEDRDARFAYMYEYLKHPELIARVHWSDARLTNKEAFMRDMHLIPGDGDLPLDLHRMIKNLPATKTLEQIKPDEDVERGLRFIEGL